MTFVKKVSISSFEHICSLLSCSEWNKSENTWNNLFNPKWKTGESYCGYALFDNECVVGFISLIFSNRPSNGKMLKTCGLSAWYVKNQYRSDSLKLLQPVLELDDYVLINLTASRQVYEISKALNFIEFEKNEICLLPRFSSIGYLRYKRLGMTKGPESKRLLNANDLQIYCDHEPYNYKHLVCKPLIENHQYCYIVFKRIKRKRLPAVRIDYISNKNLFLKHTGNIIREIFHELPFLLLFVDSRMVTQHKLPFSFISKLRVPRFYRPDKSGSVPPDDNLYSEFTLLDF